MTDDEYELAMCAHGEIGKALYSIAFSSPEGSPLHIERAAYAINVLAKAIGLVPGVRHEDGGPSMMVLPGRIVAHKPSQDEG